MDSHVPDPYSQTNQLENLAQNTVVAAYELNVPGGFQTVEPKWRGLLNQIRTIGVEQAVGGNFLLRKGVCDKRLKNSKPVMLVEGQNQSRVVKARGRGQRPDVGLSGRVDVIDPVNFDTRDACRRRDS